MVLSMQFVCSTPRGVVQPDGLGPGSAVGLWLSGWVGDRLYSVIFEAREDDEGEVLHLVTLWKSAKEEIRLYEEHA
jgi:hypothetical protein